VQCLRGQIVYLNFGGAQDIVYQGPVTVGPFDVPAFQAPAGLEGQEGVLLQKILSELQHAYAGSGVILTTVQPETTPVFHYLRRR
jgi:hypothetical protein